MRINHQPVIGRSFMHKRHLYIGSLLTRVYLAGRNQMIDKKFPFYIWCQYPQLIHTFFRRTFHIAFIANPCRAPSGEVNAEGERCTYLSILQELKGYFLIYCLLVIHPYNKSRQIRIFSRRIFGFKLQILFQGKDSPRFIRPTQGTTSIFIVFITKR